MHFSPQISERILGFQKRLPCNTSCTENHFRFYNFQLFPQIRFAAFYFLRLWVAVIRRTAFENITDKNFFTLELNRLQYLGQELTGAPDEGFSLFVLIRSRRFTHNNDIRFRIADAENEFFPRLPERTFHAGVDHSVERRKIRCRCPGFIRQSGQAFRLCSNIFFRCISKNIRFCRRNGLFFFHIFRIEIDRMQRRLRLFYKYRIAV